MKSIVVLMSIILSGCSILSKKEELSVIPSAANETVIKDVVEEPKTTSPAIVPQPMPAPTFAAPSKSAELYAAEITPKTEQIISHTKKYKETYYPNGKLKSKEVEEKIVKKLPDPLPTKPEQPEQPKTMAAILKQWAEENGLLEINDLLAIIAGITGSLIAIILGLIKMKSFLKLVRR